MKELHLNLFDTNDGLKALATNKNITEDIRNIQMMWRMPTAQQKRPHARCEEKRQAHTAIDKRRELDSAKSPNRLTKPKESK